MGVLSLRTYSRAITRTPTTWEYQPWSLRFHPWLRSAFRNLPPENKGCAFESTTTRRQAGIHRAVLARNTQGTKCWWRKVVTAFWVLTCWDPTPTNSSTSLAWPSDRG